MSTRPDEDGGVAVGVNVAVDEFRLAVAVGARLQMVGSWRKTFVSR
jgi:hypothetical protein